MSYTYSTLSSDIQNTLEENSTEFLDALPGIITRGQAYIQNRLDGPSLVKHAEILLSQGEYEIPLPADCQIIKSVQLNTAGVITPLMLQTNEYLGVYWPTRGTAGTPKYYAPKDETTIYIAPAATAAQLLMIEYVAKIATLTSAEPTNWFATNAETALFNSCMMFANRWAKNMQATTVWKSLTDEEIAALNNVARRNRRDDSYDRTQGSPENNLMDGAT